MLVEVQLNSHAMVNESKLHEQLDNFFLDRTILCKDYDMTAEELDEELASAIASLRISFPSGIERDGRLWRFWWEVRPKMFIFKLHEEGPSEVKEDEETGSFCQEWNLPAASFKGIWDHLHFDDDLKPRLLRYVESALLFTDKGVDHDVISWNRLVLLHGPPGTGKTSLCKALAQKLAIQYTGGIQLMEVNAHSLFSKWFSESGKLVAQLFEKIHDLLQFPDVLLFVLIDEVESLTSARKSAAGGSEPSDALRAVNALLTQLDRLQRCPNVVVMTTSNLTDAIDDAFLDRADIKTFVGPPIFVVRHRILINSIMELHRVGFVDDIGDLKEGVDVDVASNLERCSLSMPVMGLSCRALLQQCVALAEGFSCRTLKKLPFLAFIRCQEGTSVSCHAFLTALRESVQQETTDKGRM